MASCPRKRKKASSHGSNRLRFFKKITYASREILKEKHREKKVKQNGFAVYSKLPQM